MPNTGATRAVVKKSQLRTAVWTVVSVSIAFAAVILLSTVDNADGTPWLEGTVIGQSLAVVGVVAAAVLPSLIRTGRDAAIARDQLENSHVEDPSRVSNVRDDLDQKHDLVMEAIKRLEARFERSVDTLHSDVRGLRRDVGRLWDKSERQSDRIHNLEQTDPNPRKGR